MDDQDPANCLDTRFARMKRHKLAKRCRRVVDKMHRRVVEEGDRTSSMYSTIEMPSVGQASEQVRWEEETCCFRSSSLENPQGGFRDRGELKGCHKFPHMMQLKRPNEEKKKKIKTRRRISYLSFGSCTNNIFSSNNQFLFHCLLIVISSVLVIHQFHQTNKQFVSGYQLTNNLIANNLPPKFITTSTPGSNSNSEIVVRVKEGPASIGRLIYTLRGEDPDEDPLTFGVLGSMASDLLRIENVPGNQANVYLRKELDRETTESYQVVITLTDGKLGRGNWVEDVNDNYPVFGPHRTAISIREDVKVPLVIETLEASDQDEGRFGQVVYKLEEFDGDAKGGQQQSQQQQQRMFSIETIEGKGVISLISPLDYEQRALYQLRVLAVDRAIESERLTATTSILVSVTDCDDQAPLFTFVPSITRIPENLAIGSPVVRVAAIDGDRGVNNQIQYSLVSVNGQESGFERNLFSIDSDSGQISVAHELDRELEEFSGRSNDWFGSNSLKRDQSQQLSQPGSYVLQIRASEVGSSSKSVTTELTVILTDVNDETPIFNQPVYYGELLENSTPDSLVNLVPNPPTATTTSGSSGSQSMESQQQLQQQLVAKVVDRDQGTNGTFTLHLEGEHSHLFDIWPREATNEANFMIKVKSHDQSKQLKLPALDYEKTKMFQFTIVAREKFKGDSRQSSSSAQMTVYLKDSNDNYPQFESELYRVEIPENAIRGMHICAVKATDSDSGSYGSQGIRYTEIRGEKANKFKLDPLTGVVTLKTNEHGFDRETIPQHHLIVEARDANGLGNRNTTQLLIVLTDVNDQKPKFLLDQYEAFIYENELDFQNPLLVQAIDNDAPNSPNSRITYSIVNGDPQQNFTIDANTGRIRVKNSLVTTSRFNLDAANQESDIVIDGPSQVAQVSGLDFERIAQKRDDTRQFNLTIRATDSGLPESLSDSTHVIISVYDKNDHAPVFTRTVYSKSIREDAKEGSQVLQVIAQDGDHSPTNSKITYRISSGAGDKFVIDSDSGLISVASGADLDIDRTVGGQKRTNYLLNVIAFDGSFGPNQKSSSALINITIIDVNNKPPEFVALRSSSSPSSNSQAANQQQQLSIVHVNEDAPYGLIITKVTAIDLDSSAELRYSINYARSEARNEDMVLVEPSLFRDIFSIDPTDGTIKVSKQLDRELFDQVKLRLQVEDIAAQTPDQISYSYLLVKITDVNDNRPTFKKQIYKAIVNENSISGTLIATVTADDRDLNKTLKYSLDGPNELMRLIRINSRSGEVMVNDKIDREQYSLINVTVKAEDYGFTYPLMGTAQLMITVRDENDNNPIFLNSSYIGIGHLSYDQDSPIGFESVNHGDSTLPRNHNMNNTSYRLRSLGTTSLRRAEISPDSSDSIIANKLPLLAPGSSAQVREDALVGHEIAYVRAEDADVGFNGKVTYLLDSTSSGGKFRIDPDSGIISVASKLDRETQKQYSLIIEACDNYDLGYSTGESRRAFTQVNMQITDINDNAPIITTNLQQSATTTTDRVVVIQHSPSYDDIMNSPGPYEVPMSDCLFISEFQQPNEPILTVTATDADDPSTSNGQIDLSIVNNLPQNELFGLLPISNSKSIPREVVSTTSAEDSAAGFSDLSLDESSSISSTASALSEPPSRSKRSIAISADLAVEPSVAVGNFYSPTSRAQTLGSFSLMGAQQTIANFRQRPTSLTRSMNGVSTPPAASTTSTPTSSPTTPNAVQSLAITSAELVGEQQVHIVLTQSLKERVGNYSILVRATDRGQPSLSTVKVINICVQDVNNHAPVFTRPPLNYTLRVMENATLNTFVTQVEATDADHGLNGQLQYLLKPTNIQNSNNDWQSFKIDRSSGVITTAKQFNRQFKKYYTLRVQAQDFGKPTSLSSDIDINIMIVNSGQYQPEFDQQTQTLQFTENVAPGIEWFTLLPTTNLDDDPALISASETTGSTANNNWLAAATPCYFIIDSDDLEQVFHLDKYTHRITNQRVIDREKKSNYTLLVRATNNCNKPPSSPVYTVTATRQLGDKSHSSDLPTTTGSSILDYHNLADSSSEISHQVENSRTRVARSVDQLHSKQSLQQRNNNDTGLIGIASKLIASSSPAFISNKDPISFNLAGMDNLLSVDKSLLKVVIKVKDLNDNAPKFTQRVYTGGITTEADFGTVFMIVQAIDADTDANSQVVYSIVKPIKRNLVTNTGDLQRQARLKRAALQQSATISSELITTTSSIVSVQAPTTMRSIEEDGTIMSTNDISSVESDDLFVINPQTGEISLNFDPQKHMKGYFEFEIMANDTDGLFDSAKVFIYLLRQDQRVKFVLRLTPQELRQRLNKFRSVFGNITGAIVNIDSYKYYENLDGSVDKKKTSLYLHFVNPDDNTIIDVDKVLTLIDKNIEYLNELYKEFHVLSSDAAYLPLSSSALIDPIDQIRTGLLGISSFLALILVLVIALCLNQRTRYERQLKAATVTAFGSSSLHLDPDYHGQTNLPNTNLHSQDPNPIWMNGYGEQDWLTSGKHGGNVNNLDNSNGTVGVGIEDGDYLSSENSDLNSLSGVNSVTQLHYNGATTATPRDSLTSSHGRVSGSGSGSGGSTTNERQALCQGRNQTVQSKSQPQVQQQQHQQQQQRAEVHQYRQQLPGRNEQQKVVGVLKKGSTQMVEQSNGKRRGSQQADNLNQQASVTHSTFGAFKEVTIYTDHQQQKQQQQASQVNRIASELNAKQQQAIQQRVSPNQHIFFNQPEQKTRNHLQQQQSHQHQQQQQQHRIVVHSNGTDVNQGITKMGHHQQHHQQQSRHILVGNNNKSVLNSNQRQTNNGGNQVLEHPSHPAIGTAENFENNLSKLSILNLETTEL